jgi:hypothetical protein
MSDPDFPVNERVEGSYGRVPKPDPLGDLLQRMPVPFDDQGGVAEMSVYSGTGALWTRNHLRSETVKVAPVSVEGGWYVVAVLRMIASGEIAYGFDDDGMRRAATAMVAQFDKVLDLYDS